MGATGWRAWDVQGDCRRCPRRALGGIPYNPYNPKSPYNCNPYSLVPILQKIPMQIVPIAPIVPKVPVTIIPIVHKIPIGSKAPRIIILMIPPYSGHPLPKLCLGQIFKTLPFWCD